MALESKDTNPRVRSRPQRNRLKHIKEIRLAIEPSRKVGHRKVKLKKPKANTSPKSIPKRAKCKERDLSEPQEDRIRATRLRIKEGTNLRTISMVRTMLRSIISNTMVKKLHMVLSSTHTKKAANPKPQVDSNSMTNTTTRSITRKLLRPTLRKVKESTESVNQREVLSMRQHQLKGKTSLIEPREQARIMKNPYLSKKSKNMNGELPIIREEVSMLSLHNIKRLILNIKKAIEAMDKKDKSPRDTRLEDLNIRKDLKLKKGDLDKNLSGGKKETINTKKDRDMLKKVLINIKMPKKNLKHLKLNRMFALRSLIMNVEEVVVVMVEGPNILMIRLGLIIPGKIEGTHLDKEPSEMRKRSRTKKSKLIKRKESRRSKPIITDLGEKAEDVDMWKEIDSLMPTIGQSAVEAEALEMTTDTNGAKMRNLIVLITIVKIATKRMPISLSQGLISRPSR